MPDGPSPSGIFYDMTRSEAGGGSDVSPVLIVVTGVLAGDHELPGGQPDVARQGRGCQRRRSPHRIGQAAQQPSQSHLLPEQDVPVGGRVCGRLLVADVSGGPVQLVPGLRGTAAGAAITQADPNRCLDLTGKISLPEMIEWIRLSELMISNDTGPMHVAAALGKPVVGIFGPTEPRRTGPYHQLQNVVRIDLPCAPCMKAVCTYFKPNECLLGISPEMVFQRTTRVLSGALA